MTRWLALFWVFFCAPIAHGSTDETMCDRAAAAAAHGSDVPVDILRALTRTETGRARNGKLTPWPWTVNMEGVGHWFATREEALEFVQRHFKRGARSFDVGCFQINYRWHGEAFATIAAMFDPLQNAQYAASFLTELRGQKRNWRQAVGRYHSKTPKYAKKYTARFDRIHAALAPQQARPLSPAPRITEVSEATLAATAQLPASAEARGMQHLSFLASPSGSAIIEVATSDDRPADPLRRNLSLLDAKSRNSLFTSAKPLFN